MTHTRPTDETLVNARWVPATTGARARAVIIDCVLISILAVLLMGVSILALNRPNLGLLGAILGVILLVREADLTLTGYSVGGRVAGVRFVDMRSGGAPGIGLFFHADLVLVTIVPTLGFGSLLLLSSAAKNLDRRGWHDRVSGLMAISTKSGLEDAAEIPANSLTSSGTLTEVPEDFYWADAQAGLENAPANHLVSTTNVTGQVVDGTASAAPDVVEALAAGAPATPPPPPAASLQPETAAGHTEASSTGAEGLAAAASPADAKNLAGAGPLTEQPGPPPAFVPAETVVLPAPAPAAPLVPDDAKTAPAAASPADAKNLAGAGPLTEQPRPASLEEQPTHSQPETDHEPSATETAAPALAQASTLTAPGTEQPTGLAQHSEVVPPLAEHGQSYGSLHDSVTEAFTGGFVAVADQEDPSVLDDSVFMVVPGDEAIGAPRSAPSPSESDDHYEQVQEVFARRAAARAAQADTSTFSPDAVTPAGEEPELQESAPEAAEDGSKTVNDTLIDASLVDGHTTDEPMIEIPEGESLDNYFAQALIEEDDPLSAVSADPAPDEEVSAEGTDGPAPAFVDDRSEPVMRLMPFTSTGRVIHVTGPTIIGRAPLNTSRYPEAELVALGDQAPSVSKTHAAMMPTEHGILVTDLGSSNGTRVVRSGKARRIPTDVAVMVHEGGVVLLGQTAYRVQR